MAGLRRHRGATLIAILWLAVAGPLAAQPAGDDLIDDPVLEIETGVHNAKIWNVDVAGGLVATAAEDKTIRLWDRETGEALRRIRMPIGRGDVGTLFAVALSPDGTLVAAGGLTRGNDGPAGQPVHLFDTQTGVPVAQVGSAPLPLSGTVTMPVPAPVPLEPDAVREMQTLLGALGHDAGPPDGILGPGTLSAARAFAAETGTPLAGDPDSAFLDALRVARAVQVYGPAASDAALPRQVAETAFSPDGRYLAVTMTAGGGLVVFDREADWAPVAWDRAYADHAVTLGFAADGTLYTTSYDGGLRRYASGDFRRTASRTAGGGVRPGSVSVSPDGARLAVGYEDTTAVTFHDPVSLAHAGDARTADIDPARASANLVQTAFLSDGRLVAAGRSQTPEGRRYAVIWDDPARPGRRVEISRGTVSDLAVDGDALVASAADPAVVRIDPEGGTLWRVDPVIADFRGQEREFSVSADGASVAFGLNRGYRDLVRFDLHSRLLTEDPRTDDLHRPLQDGLDIEGWDDTDHPTLDGRPLQLSDYEDARGLAIHPDLTRFVIAGESSLRAFDASGTQLWVAQTPGDTRAVAIPRERDLVVALHDDGSVRWYRLEDGQLILSLFVHADSLAWVAWTPEGFFTSSAGADDLIGWSVGGDPGAEVAFHAVSAFLEQYRRPELIDQVLASGSSEAARRAAQATTGIPQPEPEPVADLIPPSIEIGVLGGTIAGAERVTVPVTIDPGSQGTIDEVHVYLEDAAGRAQEQPALPVAADGPSRFFLSLSLTPEHRALSLFAQAGEGMVQDRIVIDWGLEAPASEARPVLHVLAIGIGLYSETVLNLDWADEDARDFIQALQASGARRYSGVRLYPLVNDAASRHAVFSRFADLRENMKEGDVAAIFFSGHGVREGPQYYLLPYDTSVSSRSDIAASSIPYAWMRDELRGIARRGTTILFLDACRSGSAAQDAAVFDVDTVASELRLANQSGRHRGIIVFASSSGNQLSVEDKGWENGAFTEALLEAFKGDADIYGDGDKQLQLREVQDFVQRRVMVLTGRQQRPQTFLPEEQAGDIVLLSYGD